MKPIDYLLISIILTLLTFVMSYVVLKFRKPKWKLAPSNTKRIFALMLDHVPAILLLFIVFIVRFYTSRAFGEEFRAYFNDQIQVGGSGFVSDLQLLFVKGLVLGYLISGLIEVVFGRSLGKKWMDLNVVSKSNSLLNRLIRFLVKPLTYLLLPISLVLCFIGKKRQHLHGLISKSWLEETVS